MCGIVGFVGRDLGTVENAANAIAHRGADDNGFYHDGALVMAHRRLAIVDLTANGHQPMISEDGNLVIVYNGEIYNHLNIRQQLIAKGYRFKSTSDTETVLYGFAEFGQRIVEMLNGIFAFAIYNKRENELFIARDQIGTKPLYYYYEKNTFGFASELKSFLSLGELDRSINATALFNYLQLLYCPGEQTPFSRVKKLLPGHFAVYNIAAGSLKISSYYQISYGHVDHKKTEHDWIAEVDTTLLKAVESQLMSDVPIGYFLSGGLDSSLIVAMSKKLQPGKPLPCFTIATGKGYEKEGFADDLKYAKKVAAHLKVDLNVIESTTDILSFFDKMIWHLDEPQADPAPLHVYNICRGAMDKNIKVLMSGTAGDDLFSGYRRHQAMNLEKLYRYIPEFAGGGLTQLSQLFSANSPSARRIKKVLNEAGKSKHERMVGYFSWITSAHLFPLFNKDVQQSLDTNLLPENYFLNKLNSLPPDTSDLNKMLFLELQGFLPDHNLNYSDKMSMACGVETRVPFLDMPLVSLAAALPDHFKMKGKTTKYILKKVAEKYLPHDVIYRPKTGFGAPVREWIKNDMRSMVDERVNNSLPQWNLFDMAEIKKLIALNQKGKIDASLTIWGLLAIDSWMHQFYKQS